jgi:hypothetical protein
VIWKPVVHYTDGQPADLDVVTIAVMVIVKKFKDSAEKDIIVQNPTQHPYVFYLSSFANTQDCRVNAIKILNRSTPLSH